MQFNIVDVPTPTKRRNSSTQEAINAIAAIPLGKAASIPKENVSTVKTAAKYYMEDQSEFVVKTQAQADGGILLWRESKPKDEPAAYTQAQG